MGKIKRILIILMIAVLCLSNSGCSTVRNVYADNVILPTITNDSFEFKDGESNMEVPSGWQIEVVAGNVDKNAVTFVNENAYDGQRYFQVKDNVYTIKTSDYIDIDPAKNYIFGVKYMTSSLDSTCQILVEMFDNLNKQISTIIEEVKQPKLTDTWLDAHVCFKADDNVSKVKIAIYVKALGGSVGIDYAYGNKDIIKTHYGASINLQKDKTALRFSGQVDKETYDDYLDNSVSVGVIVMPTDMLNDVGEFTIKGLESAKKQYVDVPIQTWNNQDSFENDGYYSFSCAIDGMNSTSVISREFSARAYIKISVGKQERYIYSEYDTESHSRSIKGVALKLKAGEGFANYDELQRIIIDAYALGELPKIER